MSQKAVILVSGGLDSSTVLAIALEQGFECYTLSFDYGQRHRSELEAAKRISEIMDVKEHKIVQLDLGSIGGSALTDIDIDVLLDFVLFRSCLPSFLLCTEDTLNYCRVVEDFFGIDVDESVAEEKQPIALNVWVSLL
mgnify:CR=1 FL=1